MSIPLEKSPIIPNAVYLPQILIQTGIHDGRLVTSVQIHFAAAAVDKDGKWTSTGQGDMAYIPDLENLDEDLKICSPIVEDIYPKLIQIAGVINKARKVL